MSVLIGSHRERTTYEFNSYVSGLIGGGVSPERVGTVISLALEGGHIFHGVRRPSAVPSVLSSGILPLTPEGHCSCWNHGIGLFAERATPLGTVNSTFFNYAHSRDGLQGYSGMTLAVTNVELIADIQQINVNVVGEIGIKQPVPRDRICVLRVESGLDRQGSISGFQHTMFGLLEKVLSEGYRPGDLIVSRFV